jgi:hypothetical protein
MKRVIFGLTLVLAGVLLPGAASVGAADPTIHVSANLTGFQETPSVLSNATGTFTATVTSTSLTYTLTFANLSAPVTQSHIHFGQKDVAGGVMIFLCGTAASPGPAGTPACPQAGTVTRTVTSADVIGPAGQGVPAGAPFADVVRIIRGGVAYANVHTTAHPAGEIRGQIRIDD